MRLRSFTEINAPKHEGLEEWKELMKPVQHRQFVALVEPVERPKTLLEFYLGNDLRQLLNDMEVRPEHYTDRQQEVLRHLVLGALVSSPVTTQDKDDLFYQWMRQSDLSAKSKDLVSAITDARHRESAEDASIIMDDGRSLAEHQQHSAGSPATFETQGFGDKIII